MLNTKYKLKTSALLVGLMLCCSAVFAAEPAEGVQFVKYDRPANVSTMPANFRTAQSQYKESKTGVYPTREGLNELQMSGSSYFSKNEFKELLKKIPKERVIVLDLRNESHGYINDDGVSWYSRYKTYNKGLNASQVNKREKALLKDAKEAGTINIATQAKDKSIASLTEVKVDSVMTEREFVESLGVKYYRIPIMDYSAPTRANIDQFVKFYKSLPKDAWIHAHCEAGVGRTTITLQMIDMIHNATKLSYDEIMTREVLLGGQDVRFSAQTTKDPYKKANYPKRAEFTKRFYDYAKAHPNLDITYSQWCEQQGYAD